MKIRDIVIKSIKNGRSGGIIAFVFAAILSFTVFAGWITTKSLLLGAGNLQDRLGADIAVVPKGQEADYQGIILSGEPVECSMDRKNEETIRSIEGVDKITPVVYLASLNASCCSVPIQIIGFDKKTDFVTQPWISEEFISKSNEGSLIIGSNIAADVDNTLTFFGRKYDIGARLNETGTGMDKSVYVSFDGIEEIIRDAGTKGVEFGSEAVPAAENITDQYISAFLISVKEGYSTDSVAAGILRNTDLGVVQSKNIYSSVVDGIDLIAQTIRKIVMIVMLIVMGSSILLYVYRVGVRRKEWAVFRMMGALDGWLLKLIVAETLAIAVAGSLAGIVIASLTVFPFSDYIAQQIELPYYGPDLSIIIKGIVLSIGSVVGTAIVPGLIAGAIALKTECYELMRQERI